MTQRFHKLIAIIAMALLPIMANAQNQYDVYAGFMFHFGKYVQWPDNMQTGDFVVGVVGNSAMKTKLDNLAASKNINGRKIVIKKVVSAADVEGCNILFIPASDISQVASLKGAAKSKKVLLVTEGDGNISKGSIFNFIEKDGKVRFEFSQAEADAHGLKVSSDLVKLAIVK